MQKFYRCYLIDITQNLDPWINSSILPFIWNNRIQILN